MFEPVECLVCCIWCLNAASEVLLNLQNFVTSASLNPRQSLNPATVSHLACCSSSISCRHSWVKCGPTSGGTRKFNCSKALPRAPRTHNYCQPRLMNTVNLPGRTSECLQKCLRLWASLGTTSRKDLPDTWYMLSFHISKFGLYSSRMWILKPCGSLFAGHLFGGYKL